MLRGHNVDHGAPVTSAIRLGGGRMVEVGSSNLAARWQLESAINERPPRATVCENPACVQKAYLSIDDFVRRWRRQYTLIVECESGGEDFARLGGERRGYEVYL